MQQIIMDVGFEVTKVEIDLKNMRAIATAQALLQNRVTIVSPNQYCFAINLSPELYKHIVDNIESEMAHQVYKQQKIADRDDYLLAKIRRGESITEEDILRGRKDEDEHL